MMIFACIIASVGLSLAQTTRATGTVIDDTGEAVIGASVVAKGTTVGTVTGIDGTFSLNVPSNANTLVISLIGYKKQEVGVGTDLKISLQADAELIEEVVVVAYGTQSARTVASSISTVKADAIKDVPSPSFDQMLQGRAAGVQITTPSAGVGQPPIVRVRGVNSITSGTRPLYVVDGVPIESGDVASMGNANALADINPADIVSMEILKDAAAASLYGSRAANGVILITTRQGTKGKVKVSYDGFIGFSQKTGFYEMMNAQEYTDFKNMAVKNRYGTDEISLTNGYTSPYGNKAFNLMPKPGGGYYDTDWSESAFQDGLTQGQTLSVSGGTDAVQYYLSTNFTTQEGIVKGDKYNRLGFKANVVAKATDWLKVGINMNTTTAKTSYVDAARNGSNFSVGGFPRMALINAPNIPMYNEDGTPFYETRGLGYGGNTVFNTYSNPAKILDIGNGIDTETNRVIGILFAEVNPFKGLILKTQFNVDNLKVEDFRFWSPIHGDGVNYNGLANAYNATTKNWTWSNTATYSFDINKDHHFNLLAGIEAFERKYSYWTAQRRNLSDDKFTDFQGPFLEATSSGNISERSMLSYFGRINYDYAYKYILSLNYRRDGYSALGVNNRWGGFGGVSAAWRVSEEPFFEPIKGKIEDLKIKASYGVVGNTNISDYASKSFYRSYFYGNGGTYELRQIGDPDLKWESSTKYDVGFNMSFLDRFTLDFDYYLTKSKDLILDVPQAPSLGIPENRVTTNIGEMQNSGIEVTLSADIIRNKEFSWTSSFNITTNKNKVNKLVEPILGMDASGLEQSNITVEGKSLGQLYLYPTAGVDPETGRRLFITPEGRTVQVIYGQTLYEADGKTIKARGNFWEMDGVTPYNDNLLEQVIAGNTLPTWYGGWTNNFKYKNFDLSLFFQFSGGNKIYNGTKASVSDMRFWNNTTDVLKNYWTPDRRNADFPIPVYGDNMSNGSGYAITDWVEKGDYLRLKNVSLGYTFDTRNWSSKIGISSLRLYAQAQNLFVITGYSGMDPETLTNVLDANLSGGTDKNTLPQARTYTFGVSLTF